MQCMHTHIIILSYFTKKCFHIQEQSNNNKRNDGLSCKTLDTLVTYLAYVAQECTWYSCAYRIACNYIICSMTCICACMPDQQLCYTQSKSKAKDSLHVHNRIACNYIICSMTCICACSYAWSAVVLHTKQVKAKNSLLWPQSPMHS